MFGHTIQYSARVALLTLAITFLPALAPKLAAQDSPLLHYTLYYPPYWDHDGKAITGYHARLSKAIYEKAELNVEMHSVPYARISEFLLPDDVAIVAYGGNPKTDHKLLFPLPQTSIRLKAYSLKSHEVPSKLEEFANTRVSIKRGYPLGSFEAMRRHKTIELIEANTVAQAIQLLLIGRVDYLVTLDDPYRKDIQTVDARNQQIWSQTLETLDGWPIAVIKSHPQAKSIYTKIKEAYEALRQDGTISYRNQRLLLSSDSYE